MNIKLLFTDYYMQKIFSMLMLLICIPVAHAAASSGSNMSQEPVTKMNIWETLAAHRVKITEYPVFLELHELIHELPAEQIDRLFATLISGTEKVLTLEQVKSTRSLLLAQSPIHRMPERTVDRSEIQSHSNITENIITYLKWGVGSFVCSYIITWCYLKK